MKLVLDDALARRLDAAIAETEALAAQERAQTRVAEQPCREMPTPPCLIDRATRFLPESLSRLAPQPVREVVDAQLAIGNLDGAHIVIMRSAGDARRDAKAERQAAAGGATIGRTYTLPGYCRPR